MTPEKQRQVLFYAIHTALIFYVLTDLIVEVLSTGESPLISL